MRTHSSGEKLPRPGLSEPAGPKLHEEPPKPASQDVHGHRRHPGLERADVLASPARGPRPGQGLLHRLLRQGGVPGNDTEASHEAPIVLRKERTDLFVVQAALRVRVGTSKTLWGHGLLWRGPGKIRSSLGWASERSCRGRLGHGQDGSCVVPTGIRVTVPVSVFATQRGPAPKVAASGSGPTFTSAWLTGKSVRPPWLTWRRSR